MDLVDWFCQEHLPETLVLNTLFTAIFNDAPAFFAFSQFWDLNKMTTGYWIVEVWFCLSCLTKCLNMVKC
jgi:hypothetical protein